jgi:hypothetical protein
VGNSSCIAEKVVMRVLAGEEGRRLDNGVEVEEKIGDEFL